MNRFQLENHLIVLGVELERNQWPTKTRDVVICDPYNHRSYLRISKVGRDNYSVTTETVPRWTGMTVEEQMDDWVRQGRTSD